MTIGPPTALYVQYNKGHFYVGNSQGAREKFLKIDVDDVELAKSLANRLLAIYSADRQTNSEMGWPAVAGVIPGSAFWLGDTIDGDRLQSYTIQVQDENVTVTTTEVLDRLDEAEAGLMRRIARSSAGVTSEYGVPEIKREGEGKATDTEPEPFSLGQELYPTTSPWWVCGRPYWCAFVDVTLETAGTTTSRIDLCHNGDVVKSVILSPGENRKVARVNRGWKPNPPEVMFSRVTVAGQGAANLVVTPRGTMI